MLSTALKCKGGYGQKAHAWSAARGGCCILSPAKGWASGSSRTSGLGFLTHRRAFPPHQGLLRKTEEIRHGDSCVWRGNPEGDQASDQTLLTPRRHRRIRRTMTVLMREGDAEARARPADRASLYSHWGPCGLSPLSLSPGPFPPPSSAREKTGAPKKQRLSPAVDVADETPDLATVDRLPEKSGEVDTSASAAGGPQKVIYAQLDHPAFTQRVARAVSPLSTEPTAKSSMYAVLARN
ncbi:leukocyte-associated immunoglobulin-like receptor 1 isoform X7 [Sagmatias obliquidens]|uniref:leukocyte-associated immunoglobulin-like receptor 1 isoform X7 n=1 Tax=Sagmatias obliquidens TaxID=3371155 RepID=UPI000F442EC1|nr:leukocyte-associated immunoglobulin-like receptor 1 isoform X7 [Lagenorhynchus obliquidens]